MFYAIIRPLDKVCIVGKIFVYIWLLFLYFISNLLWTLQQIQLSLVAEPTWQMTQSTLKPIAANVLWTLNTTAIPEAIILFIYGCLSSKDILTFVSSDVVGPPFYFCYCKILISCGSNRDIINRNTFIVRNWGLIWSTASSARGAVHSKVNVAEEERRFNLGWLEQT